VKITGYKLQQAIREQMQRRDAAAARFNGTLMAFPDEQKQKPTKVFDEFMDAERKLASLQVAQARYNLSVQVKVGYDTITLHEAVKRVGGAGRGEKMWRSASTPREDRYSYREESRAKDSIVPSRQISFESADELRRTAAQFAASLREAIAIGNATERDLDVEIPPHN
jgi:hypothetical protein